MKERLKRAGVGVAVGALVVLGGGFASADYQDGDASADAEATVTYTVSSFRAIELTGEEVDFEVVRQGEIKTVPGPTLYFGTTWGPHDQISAYLDTVIDYGVELYVTAAAPSAPVDDGTQCTYPGDSEEGDVISEDLGLSGVAIADATLDSAKPIITDIDNCGAPDPLEGYTGTVDSLPVVPSDSWATATTSLTLDTRFAADSEDGPGLAAQVDKTLFFIIEAGAGG